MVMLTNLFVYMCIMHAVHNVLLMIVKAMIVIGLMTLTHTMHMYKNAFSTHNMYNYIMLDRGVVYTCYEISTCQRYNLYRL